MDALSGCRVYAEKVYPIDKIEFGSIEAIKQCVNAGLGVAFLPEMVVKKDLAEGKMREVNIGISPPSVFTHIAWHQDKQMTTPLETFIALTRQYLR